MSTADNNFSFDPLSHELTLVGRLVLGGIVGPFQSVAGQSFIYQDSTSGKLKASENGGAPVNLLTGGGGGSAYQFVQNQGTTLPQQDTLNFVGTALVASDGGTKTNVTLSQSPAGSVSVVGTGRLINTAAPLTGGGDLSADRTFAMPQATTSVDGYLSHADWNTFNNKGNGTVTSVALTVPGEFTVSGSPITSSGTLAVTKASQSANLFWASPNGSSGAPVFRAVVSADLPTSGVTAGSYTSANITVDAHGIVTAAANGSGGGTSNPAVSATLAVGVNISSSTLTAVPFDTTSFDTDPTMHNNVTNNTRLTCNHAGYYLVTGAVAFAFTGASYGLQISIRQTNIGGQVFYNRTNLRSLNDSNFSGDGLSVNALIQMAVGDYVELVVFQDSGSPLALHGADAGDNDQARFSMHRVST